MSGAARAKLIWALVDRIAADEQVLAELETLDNGKPLADTLAIEFPVGAELLRYMGGWAAKHKRRERADRRPRTLSRREPKLGSARLGSTLAAGCTRLLKPVSKRR